MTASPAAGEPEGTVVPPPSAPLSEVQAMARATALAALGPAHGPNPRVGCVLLDREGLVVGEGWHRGAGTPHAEVAALADARARGHATQGLSAFVTLEPCNHTGRTGPCAVALVEAGVSAVRYAVEDPNPVASRGAATLAAAGVDVQHLPWDEARELNRRWLIAVRRGRPYVIAKWAQTLDGRIAAADGTSLWITGEEARAHAHTVRAQVDAMVVGTGTVLADDPELSARPAGVSEPHQPLRVVVGHTPTPHARVWRDGNALAVASHDPHAVLAELARREVRTVLLEGGAVLESAFLRHGLVDEIHAYVAPALLGDGAQAVGGLGIATMAQALRATKAHASPLGMDTLITALLTDD